MCRLNGLSWVAVRGRKGTDVGSQIGNATKTRQSHVTHWHTGIMIYIVLMFRFLDLMRTWVKIFAISFQLLQTFQQPART